MASPAKNPDAFDMYCYASDYKVSADLLREMHWAIAEKRRQQFEASLSGGEWRELQHLMTAHIPGGIAQHVLTSLSLEIYLKCLHRIRGKHPPKSHRLDVLFEMLSLTDRRAIKKRYDTATGHLPLSDPSSKTPWHVSLESALIRATKYFVEVRYGYEVPAPKGPFSGNPRDVGGNLGIPQAIEAVREIIHAKHPDWEQAYLHRQRLD